MLTDSRIVIFNYKLDIPINAHILFELDLLFEQMHVILTKNEQLCQYDLIIKSTVR